MIGTRQANNCSKYNDLITEVLFDYLDWYGGKVVAFDTCVEILSIWFIAIHNKVTMDMAVNIASVVTRQAGRVYWDMSKDQATKEIWAWPKEKCTAYILEILREIFELTLVVVATDQNLSAI